MDPALTRGKERAERFLEQAERLRAAQWGDVLAARAGATAYEKARASVDPVVGVIAKMGMPEITGIVADLGARADRLGAVLRDDPFMAKSVGGSDADPVVMARAAAVALVVYEFAGHMRIVDRVRETLLSPFRQFIADV